MCLTTKSIHCIKQNFLNRMQTKTNINRHCCRQNVCFDGEWCAIEHAHATHTQFTGSQESILQLDMETEDVTDNNEPNNADVIIRAHSVSPTFIIRLDAEVSIFSGIFTIFENPFDCLTPIYSMAWGGTQWNRLGRQPENSMHISGIASNYSAKPHQMAVSKLSQNEPVA